MSRYAFVFACAYCLDGGRVQLSQQRQDAVQRPLQLRQQLLRRLRLRRLLRRLLHAAFVCFGVCSVDITAATVADERQAERQTDLSDPI